MKYIGIIPARGGSKGIPLKNIALLNGKPLIHYTIKAGLKSNIDKLVLSTDSSEISKVASSYGIEIIKRPINLASDTSPTLDTLLHALESINENFDAVITLQPTSPFRTETDINQAINLFETNYGADSLVSVQKIPHNMQPYSAMFLDEEGYLQNFINQDKQILRRQDKEYFFARNGASIYISKVKNLHKGILSGNILPFEMSDDKSLDIDNFRDLEKAEKFFSNESK